MEALPTPRLCSPALARVNHVAESSQHVLTIRRVEQSGGWLRRGARIWTGGRLGGSWGIVLVTIAAMLSFSSVANAGIMSSSRYPLYPWLHLFGIAVPLWLVAEMGWLPICFTAAVLALGVAWYQYYARDRVVRDGAIYHVFERLGRHRFEGLDRELRSILKEKGLRDADPFEEVVARAFAIDLDRRTPFEDVVQQAAAPLAQRLPCTTEHLVEGFLKGTRIGATPVARGAALPHVRVHGGIEPEMVLVRCRHGVHIDTGDVFGGTQSADHVHALFFLVSS